jgi:hypothetical protein
MIVMVIVVMGLVPPISSFSSPKYRSKLISRNLNQKQQQSKLKILILRFHKRAQKINTGVIGLAILFLSLAFFFLYLKYVYQIEIIETEAKSMLLK